MSWVQKHAPANELELVGQTDARTRLKQWGTDFRMRGVGVPCLVYGRSGLGKRCISEHILRCCGFSPFIGEEKDVVECFMPHIGFPDAKPPAVLFYIDANGGKLLKRLMHGQCYCPVVCLADEKIPGFFHSLGLRRPIPINVDVARLLSRVVRKEGILISKQRQQQIADACHGDLRQALVRLQEEARCPGVVSGPDLRYDSVFDMLTALTSKAAAHDVAWWTDVVGMEPVVALGEPHVCVGDDLERVVARLHNLSCADLLFKTVQGGFVGVGALFRSGARPPFRGRGPVRVLSRGDLFYEKIINAV